MFCFLILGLLARLVPGKLFGRFKISVSVSGFLFVKAGKFTSKKDYAPRPCSSEDTGLYGTRLNRGFAWSRQRQCKPNAEAKLALTMLRRSLPSMPIKAQARECVGYRRSPYASAIFKHGNGLIWHSAQPGLLLCSRLSLSLTASHRR